MTAAVKTSLRPDAIGLAVAAAAQRAAAPDTVLLFGSRARGDHQANSDVDLFIVRSDAEVARKGNPWQAVMVARTLKIGCPCCRPRDRNVTSFKSG